MKKEFIESTIVLLGDFKPSTFDKLFFIKRDLLSEDDFSEPSIFTPNFAQITTKELTLTIEQNRIVLANRFNIDSDLIKRVSEKINLSENNIIKAIGYNFKWFLFIDASENIHNYTKSRFYSPTNKVLNNCFNSDKVAYGYYISDNFMNSRMKLDVKPNILQKVNSSIYQNILSFDFNFHIDNLNTEIIRDSFNNYKSYIDKVKNIISDYE